MSSTTSTSPLPSGMTLKRSLQAHDLYHTTLQRILDIVQKIPQYLDIKDDPETLLLVCNLIENIVPTNSKIDKQALAVDIMTGLYSLTPDEQTKTKTQIQFLYNNKKIKKTGLVKMSVSFVTNWIKKKFL